MKSSKSSTLFLGGNSITPKKSQISCAKKWCFTMNNYTDSSLSSIFSFLKVGDRSIVGKEVGETGTKHLQGFIEFKAKCRPLERIKIQGIHWEKCRLSAQTNIEYCSKDGDYEIFGNITIKKEVKILKVEEFYDWEKIIIDLIKENPSDRTIFWFTDLGKCGTGKTTFCKYLIVKYNAIVLGGKCADMKNGIVDYIKNNDGCTPELILINLPKTFDIHYLSYTGIEEVKDMMFYSGKYEGGMVCGNCPHLLIFSNELPDWDKVDVQRWKVYNIVDNKFMDAPKQYVDDFCLVDD